MPTKNTDTSIYVVNHLYNPDKIYENLFLYKNKASSHSLLGGLNLNLITISRQDCPLS